MCILAWFEARYQILHFFQVQALCAYYQYQHEVDCPVANNCAGEGYYKPDK